MVNEEVIVIIQARIDSKRLPKKVLLPISNGLSSIEIIKKRLSKSKILKNFIFQGSKFECTKKIL